jgi:hypothetical protein
LCRDAAGVNFVSDFASEWNREFIGAPKWTVIKSGSC